MKSIKRRGAAKCDLVGSSRNDRFYPECDLRRSPKRGLDLPDPVPPPRRICSPTRVELQAGGMLMRQIIVGIMAIVIADVSVQGAIARKMDNPNYRFCKSDQKLANVAECKENGGTK